MHEALSHGFSEACFEADEFDYGYIDLDQRDDLDDEEVQDYFDSLDLYPHPSQPADPLCQEDVI